uniref:PKD domain-containing protein n=1 Tax=Aquimarina pacifica TaxID=1296415 RepID=UPI00054E2596
MIDFYPKLLLYKPLRGIFIFLLFSAQLFASPDCPILVGNFGGFSEGATSGSGETGWYLDRSDVPNALFFAIKSNRVHAENLGGEGIWYSNVFSAQGYQDFQVSVKIHSEGNMNATEYAKIYYKLDGGPEILLDERTGNFGTIDFISPLLNGDNVQIIVKFYNYDNGSSQSSKYYIEEFQVFKEEGPCTADIDVTASVEDGGVLTCINSSVNLLSNSDESDASYSWTGPDSFVSTEQNPEVSVAGTYTVTVTSSAGVGSASVTVTEDKTGPNISATGGDLGCGDSVVIGATSNITNASYVWTGPGNFTSTSQNPIVTAIGTYFVTVTNPSNGCTNTTAVTVTSGEGVETTIWLENFDNLADGTTQDNGSTAWSSENPGSGSAQVFSNVFVMNNIGSGYEAVWISEIIDIENISDVNISVDVCSAGLLETTDYLRLYYKLDNGSEILFNENLGEINGNSAIPTNVSINALNGATVQILARSASTYEDESYFLDNVRVYGTTNEDTIDVSASVDGIITCDNDSVILSGSSSQTNITYLWTGPNDFSENGQNVTVYEAGIYTLQALASSGCSSSITIEVIADVTVPDVDASVNGQLGCSQNLVQLVANSSTSGVFYNWTGPNSYTSTLQNPEVDTSGTYYVTVTDPSNGCTNSTSVNVVVDGGIQTSIWLEDFQDLDDGVVEDNGTTAWSSDNNGSGFFETLNNSFFINAIGAGCEGIWTSEIIDIDGINDIGISIDIRSAGGLEEEGTSTDYLRLYYKLDNGSEILFNESIGEINNNSNSYTTVSLGSLEGQTLQILIRSTTTASDEYYYIDNISVSSNDNSNIDISATADGILTCDHSSVTITTDVSVDNVTYLWTGPTNFTATAQNITVTQAGIYVVEVSTSGGCVGSTTVEVEENITIPNVSTSIDGELGCSSSLVELLGNSTTPDVTYYWMGPDGFSTTDQNPSVSLAGLYTLTVTDPSNGCTNSESITVTFSGDSEINIWQENFNDASDGTNVDTGATAWSVDADSSDLFYVIDNEFVVSNIGLVGEAIWISQSIDISNTTNTSLLIDVRSMTLDGALMNDSGDKLDYIRFYYIIDDGQEILFDEKLGAINNHSTSPTQVAVSNLVGSNLQIIVRARATANDEFYYFDNIQVLGFGESAIEVSASVDGVLTCATNTVTLLGDSSVDNGTYVWTGPNNFEASTKDITISEAGEYTLTVTTETGCSGAAIVIVEEDITPPNVDVAVSGALDCSVSSVDLFGSSSSNVSYSWIGPNGFSSIEQNPSATEAGIYTLTVTDLSNGCTNSKSITVTSAIETESILWLEDFQDLEDGITQDNGETAWDSDNNGSGFFETLNNSFFVNAIGAGCEGVWISEVINIEGVDDIEISVDVRSEGPLEDQGIDMDYLRLYYVLDDGSEVLFNENIGEINSNSASYTNVSVNSINGNSLQVIIKSLTTGSAEYYYFDTIKITSFEESAIEVSASVDGILTCDVDSVTITGTSSIAEVSYAWVGPDDFTATTQDITVSESGIYTLEVTTVSGCTSETSIEVEEDTAPSEVSASVDRILTCDVDSV